jgi:DeoR family glycerol-3-phosphate regulon repressor
MVLSRGARTIVVTDHTKFGRHGLVKVCDFADVRELFTDRLPPRDVALALQEAGVEVTVANGLREAAA